MEKVDNIASVCVSKCHWNPRAQSYVTSYDNFVNEVRFNIRGK